MKNFLSDLRLQRSYSRALGRIAQLFAISALVHLAVAVGRGWDMIGAVSFRKPVTFAISFALMLWAMGWVMDQFLNRPRLGWSLAAVLGFGSIMETALITMQSWRRVASHFNFATPFDSGVFAGMGLSILAVSLALVALTVWAFVESPPGLKLALRTGLILIVLGLGLGLSLIEMGVRFWETVGTVPNGLTVGTAGVAKFPHALALHGIQVFIVAAAVANRLTAPHGARLMRLVVGGYLAIVAWSIVHTNSGRAPSDPTGFESVLLFGGVAAFVEAALVWVTLRAKVSHQPSTLPV